MPTKEPTNVPTREPTKEPTKEPTEKPTKEPTTQPTGAYRLLVEGITGAYRLPVEGITGAAFTCIVASSNSAAGALLAFEPGRWRNGWEQPCLRCRYNRQCSGQR